MVSPVYFNEWYVDQHMHCLCTVWMFVPGVDIKIVQEMVENHLKSMIMKHFDPKKADSIFTDEGEVGLHQKKRETMQLVIKIKK